MEEEALRPIEMTAECEDKLREATLQDELRAALAHFDWSALAGEDELDRMRRSGQP